MEKMEGVETSPPFSLSMIHFYFNGHNNFTCSECSISSEQDEYKLTHNGESVCFNCSRKYQTLSFLHQPPQDPILSKMVAKGEIHMTEAKDQVLKNQVISKDDSETIIDRRTGKEADY